MAAEQANEFLHQDIGHSTLEEMIVQLGPRIISLTNFCEAMYHYNVMFLT